MIRIAAALIAPLLLAIAACTAQPARKVSPALWEVTGPSGEKAWLFATIHALPKPVDWRSARVESALAGSGVLVMEIATPDDPAAIGRLFRKLGESPGHPPPTQRVPAELRPAMARLLDEYGMAAHQFSGLETRAPAPPHSRRNGPRHGSRAA